MNDQSPNVYRQHDTDDGRDLTPAEIMDAELLDAFWAFEEIGFFTSKDPGDIVRMVFRYYKMDQIEQVRGRAMEISDWVQAMERELMENHVAEQGQR